VTAVTEIALRYLYNHEKIREMFDQLQLRLPKAAILNITGFLTFQKRMWIKLNLHFKYFFWQFGDIPYSS
jgi:hypothetical protein